MSETLSFGKWLLFWLFPRKCPVCRRVIPPQERICSSCREALPQNRRPAPALRHLSGIWAPYVYRAGVQKIISAFKFRGRRELAPLLAQMMAESLPEKLRPELIIGVPMHPKRRRQRGYNQADLLARELGKLLGVPVSTSALVKCRSNRLQHNLSAAQRRENVKDVYQVKDPAQVAGKAVLLVDDVFTTGSTLEECARVLAEAGAGPVWGVVFARAEEVKKIAPDARKPQENALSPAGTLAKQPPDTV